MNQVTIQEEQKHGMGWLPAAPPLWSRDAGTYTVFVNGAVEWEEQTYPAYVSLFEGENEEPLMSDEQVSELIDALQEAQHVMRSL